ncbi:protein Bouncer-like [Conger conger]|uniref:protein Bouncer-like n=1 Tax=Conger conger TaxID=82655 RepID=UPI002A5A7F1E|nr:protein Bouncer-like [Conger conger]
MVGSFGLLVLLCSLPSVVPLRCYTCLFPAITPLDCLKFPLECPPEQRCLASTAIGTRGDAYPVILYEKSCAVASQCGLSGQKYAMGLNFTYTNECCDTDLCNTAPYRPGAILSLLLPLFLVLALW